MLSNIETQETNTKNGKRRGKKVAVAEPTFTVDQVTDEFINATQFFQKRIVKE